MNDCLLLVDLQNDYFTGGNMELVGTAKAAENAQRLLNKFRQKHLPVVHIQHISVQPGAFFSCRRLTERTSMNGLLRKMAKRWWLNITPTVFAKRPCWTS